MPIVHPVTATATSPVQTDVLSPERRLSDALRRHVEATPGTTAYLFVLVIVGIGLRLYSPTLVTELMRDSSTNWHNMSARPVLSLAASALWIDGDLFVWVPLMLLLLGFAERRFGTRRCFATFIGGHVGGTLASLVVVWDVARNGGASARIIENTIDVGVSYGFYAVAASCCSLLARPWRTVVTVGLISWLGLGVLLSETFTGVGHLSAALVGVVLPVWFARRTAAKRRGAHLAVR